MKGNGEIPRSRALIVAFDMNRQAGRVVRHDFSAEHCRVLVSAKLVNRPRRADVPFPEAMRALLHASTIGERASAIPAKRAGAAANLNAIASRVGVRQSHLWRIVHRPEERRASLDLIAKVAAALELPEDYFLETRCAAVDGYLRAHPRRLNRLYAEAQRAGLSRVEDEDARLSYQDPSDGGTSGGG